jgi:4-hydroxy-2-oxoheptanedioate aldolase
MSEEILVNPFKSALRKGETQIGLWLAMADSYSAEICAGSGFDWLLLDGEHSPLDLRTMLAQLQSVAPYPAHAVVRPPTGDPVLIKQMLDIGAQSLLIPMVETPEQAELLVRATRYAPHGFRGVGAGIARAARWGRVAHYLDQADDQVCLLLQVETRTGLDNLERIASVDGVDGVFLGAADLSASLGHIGQLRHPEVVAAMEKAIRCIIAKGKAAGLLATDEATASAYLALGARFVAVGVDVLLLVQATQMLARRFKPGATAAAPPSGY